MSSRLGFAVSGGTLTARAQGDVTISAVNGSLSNDNAGTMYLQHVFSADGNAYLTAYNSILDPFANVSTVGKAVQINAHHITLNALNGSRHKVNCLTQVSAIASGLLP